MLIYKLIKSHLKVKQTNLNDKIINFLIRKNKLINESSYLSQSEKNILQRNSCFKQKHKNQRAFIIANGPSLKNQDISKLKNEITFVMGGFHKHPILETGWQPSYYCLIDPENFKDNNNADPFYREINKKISSAIFILSLARGYGYNMKYKKLDPSKTFYCATVGTPNKIKLDMTDLMPAFHNVATFSIAIAIYMGCNPIYLLGFDHDYLANKGLYHHFYEGGDNSGGERANRFLTTPYLEIHTYYENMKTMMKIWEKYFFLDKVSKSKNIKIINSSEGGYLDVFPRISFDSIL